MRSKLVTLVLSATIGIAVSAYGQTALSDSHCKKLIEQINKEISQEQACETVQDCRNIWLGCPFGCGTPINKNFEEQVHKAVEDYNSQCQPCDYRCANREQLLKWQQGKCSIELGSWR